MIIHYHFNKEERYQLTSLESPYMTLKMTANRKIARCYYSRLAEQFYIFQKNAIPESFIDVLTKRNI